MIEWLKFTSFSDFLKMNLFLNIDFFWVSIYFDLYYDYFLTF